VGFLPRVPIRLRVTLAFAVAMAIVLAATGFFLYIRLGSALDRTIDQSLRARATDVGALVRRGDSLGKEGEGITQVIDARGAVLAATPGLGRPLLTSAEISRASREAVTIERPVPNSDEAARILATPLDTQRGPRIVVVGASLRCTGEPVPGAAHRRPAGAAPCFARRLRARRGRSSPGRVDAPRGGSGLRRRARTAASPSSRAGRNLPSR
jgi:hypothetical protein